MKAANGLRDMALVHQIAVDKDFRLERVEPAENTPHKIVKETMHRAFWDILRQQLSEDPPNYTQVSLIPISSFLTKCVFSDCKKI